MADRFNSMTLTRYLGELDKDSNSDIRFSFLNDKEFDVTYFLKGSSLFAVYTIHVN